MDRSIVYTASLPRTVDFLNTNKFAMMGLGYAMKGCLGYTGMVPAPPYVEGMSCTPTTPTADLNVHVNVGSIYNVDPVDATAYGDLGTDASHNILKQGILNDPVTLAITPPSNPGYSQVYLVQAALQDIDAGSTVLPYYNAGNPAQPFSGPGNNGTSQNTTRTVKCAVALKAGVAAPTGTQIAPSQDVGYAPMFLVTVANGQTQITGANIAQAPSAPFFPTLPSIPVHIQNGDWISADDTGSTNAVVISPLPAVTGLQKYQKFRFKVKNTNTGPSNFTVSGLTGAIYIGGQAPAALPANALLANTITEVICDGINFELISQQVTINNNSYTTGGPTAGLVNVQAFTASGTYTPTAGATKAVIYCTAGGGSGSSVCSGGAGGGAGGTAVNLISLSGISSLPVTIGAGGAATPSGRAAGSNGSDSYVGSAGSYKAYAVAGQGAQMLNGGTPGVSARGGRGGVPTVGLLLVTGGDGDNGDNSDNSYNGTGGASFWGGGGVGGLQNNTPSPAARCFGAGSGGSDDGGCGVGMSGVVIIMEF
jgi:hypothetical protein